MTLTNYSPVSTITLPVSRASLSAALATRGDYLINEPLRHSSGGIEQSQQNNSIIGSKKTNLPQKPVITLGCSIKTPLPRTPSSADRVAGAKSGPERAAAMCSVIHGHGWYENSIRTIHPIHSCAPRLQHCGAT